MKQVIKTFSDKEKTIAGAPRGLMTRELVKKLYDKLSANGASKGEVFAKISIKTGLGTERIRQILVNDYELC